MAEKIYKEKIKKILISRTDNIGDVILTLPLISECKSYFTSAKLVLLTKSVVKDLLMGYEDIDEFIFIDDFKNNIGLFKKIRSECFDIVFSVYPRLSLAVIFFLSGIKYRVGTAYRGYSFLYNIKVKEHRKSAEKHEAQYNLNLLNTVTGEFSQNINFKFKISENEKQELIKKLNNKFNLTPDDKFIIIHPGSRQSALDLPLKTLKEYIQKFLKEFSDYKIIITGTKNDEYQINCLTKSFQSEIGKVIFNSLDMFNLRELMILIELSSLFISNSTGPIHIAGALGKKIIGFYPNVPPISPVRWKPLSNYVRILTPTQISTNMEEIKAEQIIQHTNELLKM